MSGVERVEVAKASGVGYKAVPRHQDRLDDLEAVSAVDESLGQRLIIREGDIILV